MSSSKKIKKISFAEDRRKQKRLDDKKRIEVDVEKILHPYITQLYQKHLEQFEHQYDEIYKFIQQHATCNAWKIQAHQFFKNFISKKNQNRLDPFPIPYLPFTMQRDALVRNAEWFQSGYKIDEIIEKLWDYWELAEDHQSFSDDEIIANILISSMLFAGLNQVSSLNALLEYLKNPTHIQSIDQTNIIFLTPLSPGYGDLFIDEKTIRKSRNFIPDHITRLWLIHFNTRQIRKINLTVDEYLQLIFSKMNSSFNRRTYKLLRDHSNFHWTQLKDADIDPALSQCLIENIQTCGLSKHEFQNFYRPQFITNTQSPDPQKSSAAPAQPAFVQSDQARKQTLKLHKDLLKFIRSTQSDHATEHSIIEYIMLNHANLNEYSQRIVLWLISLYKPAKALISPLLALLNVDAALFQKSFQNNNPLSDHSIYTYYTRIAEPWLSHSLQYISSEDDPNILLNKLYEQIISNTLIPDESITETEEEPSQNEAKKSKSQIIQMLKRFHKFQQIVFNADSFEIEIIATQTRPRSRIIGHQTLTLLLNTLDQQNAEHLIEHTQYQYLKLIYILAYRTGMRINEILGLRIRDVEGLEKLSIWIQPYGSKKQGNLHQLKTDSSERIIPIYCLLKQKEYELFHQFMIEKRLSGTKNDYIFAEWNQQTKLQKNTVTVPLITLFNQLLPSHDYSFHSFRHSAANHFALILNCEYSPWVERLTDYSLEEYHHIRQELLRNSHDQNHWFIIAHLLGHIDPTETFRSYIHLGYFIAGTKLLKHQPDISAELAMKIMGYNPALTCFKFLNSVHPNKPFNFDQYAEKLSQLLLNQQNEWSKSNFESIFVDPSVLNYKPHDYFQFFAGTPQSKVSFKLFYQCLNRLETLEDSQQVAAEYGLPFALVDYWFNNAKKLRQLTSKKGQPRLNGLKPAKVDTQEEIKIYTYFFDKLQGEYENNPTLILQALQLFLERVTASHSGIHFPRKKVDQLEAFYSKIHNLFPTEYWNITGNDLSDLITRKNQPLLFKVLRTQKVLAPTLRDNYVRLQLFSKNKQRALGVFKFCLHLACIGKPKSYKSNECEVKHLNSK
ncbi:tyrosine-type recombinase/integrase [Acinetobacter sp. Marseille-Q1623]|uniref:tyrosine-type recombinase/integrase n=1 Tax=Acinetobacter sp. Marseille-Q1623 TaxID=2697501 RepID=UPI003A5D1D57